MTKKLALCFLTYGNLSQPALWSRIFERQRDLVNVYIHNKNEFVDTEHGLERYCLKERIPTAWGKLSLVEATLLLFRTALQDPDNEFFILLSDTCIPVHPMELIYRRLFEINSTTIFAYKANVNRYDRMWDKTCFKKEDFMMQSQWCILNRETATFFNMRDFTGVFGSDFGVPDEHYFVNLCLVHKLPFVNSKTTYTRWGSSPWHPDTFHSLTDDDLKRVKESGALFMRKISEKCKLPLYFDGF